MICSSPQQALPASASQYIVLLLLFYWSIKIIKVLTKFWDRFFKLELVQSFDVCQKYLISSSLFRLSPAYNVRDPLFTV